MWMLTCIAILQYAKNNVKHCLVAKSITVEEVLNDYLPKQVTNHIMGYFKERLDTFKDSAGRYKAAWDKVERKWVGQDKDYKFGNKSIENLL